MNTNNTSNPPFRINQKVVCVNGYDGVQNNGETLPLKSSILTVRTIHQMWGIWWLRFNEIKNTPALYKDGFKEASFDARDFAPIEENKERIKYVAVSETLRERAEKVVVESCNLS